MGFEFPIIELAMEWPEAYFGTSLLLVQPSYKLENARCGFKLPTDISNQHVLLLERVFQISTNPYNEAIKHSFFTIFPEYALPSDRFEECDQIIRRCMPKDSVCIAGFDAMKPSLWLDLINKSKNKVSNIQQEFDWVNCAGIWVKDNQEETSFYIQSKLYPNAEEQCAGQMFHGNQILYFSAKSRSFTQLICFDSFARTENPSVDVPFKLGSWLDEKSCSNEIEKPDFLFVIQYNPCHDHEEVLRSARVFLNECPNGPEKIVFANAAFRSGSSGLWCSKQDWAPHTRDTKIFEVPRVYQRMNLPFELTGFMFRSGGPEIHTLVIKRRDDIPRAANSQKTPIEYVKSHTIHGSDIDSEGKRQTALEFVLGVILKKARPTDLASCIRNESVIKGLEKSHSVIKAKIISVELSRLEDMVRILLSKENLPNPDFMNSDEEKHLIKFIYSLIFLEAGNLYPDINPKEFGKLFTANCIGFTVSIIGGGENSLPENIYEQVIDNYLNLNQPNLIIILEHCRLTPRGIVKIECKKERDRGAGQVKTEIMLEDGIFGQQDGEAKINEQKYYWTDYSNLINLAIDPPDFETYLENLKKVFECLLAA